MPAFPGHFVAWTEQARAETGDCPFARVSGGNDVEVDATRQIEDRSTGASMTVISSITDIAVDLAPQGASRGSTSARG